MRTLICITLLTCTINLPDLLCLTFWRMSLQDQSCHQNPSEPFGDYLQECRGLKDEFHTAMPFSDFYNMKSGNRQRNFNRGFAQNYELHKTFGRLTIPNFDGTRRGLARIWVQKLDTYFQINPMMNIDAIKLATLHLDEEAHEWWYHGLVTLGHNTISSYCEFRQRLMERFDRKDLKIHFRELAQL